MPLWPTESFAAFGGASHNTCIQVTHAHIGTVATSSPQTVRHRGKDSEKENNIKAQTNKTKQNKSVHSKDVSTTYLLCPLYADDMLLLGERSIGSSALMELPPWPE